MNNVAKSFFGDNLKNDSISILNKLPIVKGDKIRFQQLFQNLIGNAIKFSN
ncbi:MAG: signal transduction histidine kinase [Polaribacter sp.]|jgi:signal transduction histidine kinase